MISTAELQSELSQHYGSMNLFKIHPICNPTDSSYTEGVLAFEEKAKAGWFLDIVFSELITREKTKNEDFLSILLSVGKKGLPNREGEAWMIVTDGDEKELYKKVMEYTDCPEGDWQFFYSGKVLYIPSEH